MKVKRVFVINRLAPVLAAVLLLASTLSMAQTPQERVHAMSHVVMPFDMSKTIHIFKMATFGGVEKILMRDPRDADQVALIRRHLAHEAGKFKRGDYSDPARLHGADMPGLKELEADASRIHVAYS